MFQYRTYIACFVVSLIAAAGLTPWVIRLAKRHGFVDHPGKRKIHSRVIPLLGGIGIFVGVWLPIAMLMVWDNRVAQKVQGQGGELLLIFLGGLAMLILGIVDDKFGLNAKWKFGAQVPVAMALVAAGVSFEGIRIPFLGHLSFGAAAPFVSVLWLVGVTNAVNLIDGIDGLASGVTLLVAATLAFLAIGSDQALLAVVMCSMAGACLGFLRHNFNPAKIFLGDSGSLFLGMTLAISAVFGSVKTQLGASLLVPIILLGYPIADTLLSMVRRFLRGRPMFTGDASHIHHRLLDKGLDQRKACYLIYMFCLVLCQWTISIQLEYSSGILFSAVLLLAVAVFGLHKLGYLGYFKILKPAKERRPVVSPHHYAQTIKAKLGDVHTPQEMMRLLREVSREFGQAALEIYLPAGPLWTGSRLRDGLEMIPAGDQGDKFVQGRYQYDQTGLNVFAFYEAHNTTEALWMEKQTLFEEVCNAVNHRLLEIVKERESLDLTLENLAGQQ